jgi:hypothetical protein
VGVVAALVEVAVGTVVVGVAATIIRDMLVSRASLAGSAQFNTEIRPPVVACRTQIFVGVLMSGRGRSSFTKRLKERSRQEKQREKAERKTQRKQEKQPRNPEDDFGTNETVPEESLSPFFDDDLEQAHSSDSD